VSKDSFAVLGAGSWGTAFAIHLAKAGLPVILWGHKPQHIKTLAADKENKEYLPGSPFPDTLSVTDKLQHALDGATHHIIAVPSHAFSELVNQIKQPIKNIAWLTKGLEPSRSTFLSEIILSHSANAKFAILQGPSFAKELAQGLPTAITLATNDQTYGEALQALIHTPPLRVYLTDDITGVQLAGAVKNVLAIAAGVSDGLGFGANTNAALVTRGLSEMARLGVALGANEKTFMGLAGLGDLLLTATDNQSRNRRFGLLLGQGKSIDEAKTTIKQVVEGCQNATEVVQLAKQQQIEMPICETIEQLLLGKMNARQAVTSLLNRPSVYE